MRIAIKSNTICENIAIKKFMSMAELRRKYTGGRMRGDPDRVVAHQWEMR